MPDNLIPPVFSVTFNDFTVHNYIENKTGPENLADEAKLTHAIAQFSFLKNYFSNSQ
jgi:hypothetical protein